MATKTVTHLEDDLDGGDADETIEFGLDGVIYEIDLKTANAEKLRSALADYVNAGRRTGGRRHLGRGLVPVSRSGGSSPAPGGSGLSKADRDAIRQFAVENGYKEPAMRGRLPGELVNAWKEAGSPHY